MAKDKDIVINGHIIKPGQFMEATLNTYRLPTRTFIEIPVHVFRSKQSGPTVLLSAGMHGDETNGIEIIRKLLRGNYFNNLLCGSVVAIPIINIVSFLNGSRKPSSACEAIRSAFICEKKLNGSRFLPNTPQKNLLTHKAK